jgi:hypothetical protein
MPKASLVTPDRTNIRSTRGDSCELASCSATSVSVKTTPTKVSVDGAMIPSSADASPESTGTPPRQRGQAQMAGLDGQRREHHAPGQQRRRHDPEPVTQPFPRPGTPVGGGLAGRQHGDQRWRHRSQIPVAKLSPRGLSRRPCGLFPAPLLAACCRCRRAARPSHRRRQREDSRPAPARHPAGREQPPTRPAADRGGSEGTGTGSAAISSSAEEGGQPYTWKKMLPLADGLVLASTPASRAGATAVLARGTRPGAVHPAAVPSWYLTCTEWGAL